MAFRDLIPWSRQENRLPAPVSRDSDAHPLFSLHREIRRLLDEVFRDRGMSALAGLNRTGSWPHVGLGETDKEIRVTAELPGLNENDVEISVEGGALTIRGEKRSEVKDKDRGYTERRYGRFERRIGLPRGINRDHAAATFRDGVLTITLPKTDVANENCRRIPICKEAA